MTRTRCGEVHKVEKEYMVNSHEIDTLRLSPRGLFEAAAPLILVSFVSLEFRNIVCQTSFPKLRLSFLNRR